MNGGLASPAARRSAVPDPAPRSRPAAVVAAPVRQPPAARMPGGERAPIPTTRERLEASFAGPGAGAPTLVAEPAGPLDTRARIVNRARSEAREPVAAAEAGATLAAPVVDLAEARK